MQQLSEGLTDSHIQATDKLNYILQTKIGYGYAQQKLSRALYLLLFSQGCETVVLGLLLPILTLEWTLTTFEQSMLITTVYLGVSLGSYLQVYSDKYGRYSFILWDTIMQTIFGLLSCICWNYQSFLITRFFYGVGIGICLPLSASYITQISPGYMRATLLSKSRVYWSAGCLFSCVIGWYFLRDRSWRTLLFIIALPGLYAMVQHIWYGRQSLRYLWVQKRTQQVHQLVNMMCQMNKRAPVTQQYITNTMQQQQQHRVLKSEDIPISQMFNQKYYKSTIRLLLAWFTACFIYYGVMILLPSILERVFIKEKRDQNFKYLFIVAVSIIEVGGFWGAGYIMDHPLIGRKKGVYLGMGIVCLISVLIILIGQGSIMFLFVAFAVIKFVISITFMILYPYTAEIYETMIRGKALGLCSMSGRLATALLGVVGVYAMNSLGGNGLYVIFFGLTAFAAYGGFTMPYCTGNRAIE